MLQAALVLFVLGGKPVPAQCLSRCATDMSSCAARCGAAQTCNDHCNQRVQACTSLCTGGPDDKNANKKKLPCGIDERTQKVVPCNDKEVAAQMQELKNQKDLCKDAEGNMGPCPDSMAKAKAKLKEMGVETDCTGPDGAPVECPEKK